MAHRVGEKESFQVYCGTVYTGRQVMEQVAGNAISP